MDPLQPALAQEGQQGASALLLRRCLSAALDEERAGPSLQRFFARIARDETRHAQLARDLHDWFMTRLRRDEQAEVCRELRAALRSLPKQATRRAAQRPRSLGGPDIALARVAAQRLAEELSP